MPADPNDLFQEWRVADRAAFSAEKQLMAELMNSIGHLGQPPSEDDRARVKKLRDLANDLFTLAMAEMDRRAKRMPRR